MSVYRAARLPGARLCAIIRKQHLLAAEHRKRAASRPSASTLAWLDRQAADACEAEAESAAAELRRRTKEHLESARLVVGLRSKQ